MTTAIELCIHGFRTEECASCRTCPHGLNASRCGRCVAAERAVSRRPRVVSTQTFPSEQHAGFEIFYEPSVSGWLYRGADAAPSHLSYRSAFLARKAVDELAAARR
jgi:hypothetical protein